MNEPTEMQPDGNASRAHLTRRPVSSSRERATKSLGGERRSVREQAPLQDRLRERSSARRSGIKKPRCTDRMRRPSHHRHREMKRRSGEHGRVRLKDVGRIDRGRLQRLATWGGWVFRRLGLRWDFARATIVLRNRERFMALERREAEGAMIRNGQPRDRSQRHRCPAEGDRSVRAQHAMFVA